MSGLGSINQCWFQGCVGAQEGKNGGKVAPQKSRCIFKPILLKTLGIIATILLAKGVYEETTILKILISTLDSR
jgi:hypothetical protein